MIAGIGVDLVHLPRFERAVANTPRLIDRLFAPAERGLATRSLAARFAAKEALVKALGGSDGVRWSEIELARSGEREAPRFAFTGVTATTVRARGIRAAHVSLAHDGDYATAYVILEQADAS